MYINRNETNCGWVWHTGYRIRSATRSATARIRENTSIGLFSSAISLATSLVLTDADPER